MWDEKDLYPGDTATIKKGTAFLATHDIDNTGDAAGIYAFIIENITDKKTEFRFQPSTTLAPGYTSNSIHYKTFTMPDHDIQIKFRVCHFNGEVDCIHDDTAIFTLKATEKEVKHSFAVTVPAGVPPCTVSCNRVYKVPLLPLYITDPLWSPLYESCISPPCSFTFTPDKKHIGDKFGIAALIAGASITMFAEKEVYELTEGTTHATVPSLHMAPVNLIICDMFGVSDAECSIWISTWVLDPVFLAEEIMIVKKGKNLAGEAVTATPLDKVLILVAAAGIATPGFTEGMVLKHFKELIRLAKGSDEYAILLKTEDVANFLSKASYEEIKSFTALCRGGKFDDAIKLVDNLPELAPKNADWVLKRYETWYTLLGKNLGEKRATAIFARHGITEKTKKVVKKVIKNPKRLTRKTLVLVWIAFELPMMVGMLLMFLGLWPGSTSKRGNTALYTLSTDSKLCYNAIYIEAWDAARKGCALFEEHLTDFETFLADNKKTLEREKTYDILYDSYEGYKGLLALYKMQAGVITWPEEFNATVRHARDGDSFEIEYVREGESKRIDVRIVGTNTPEMHGKKGDIKCTTTIPAAFTVDPEWADKAKDTITALEDEVVTIQLDLSHIYDSYNRLLARVLSGGGTDIGLEQISNGLACYYFREAHNKVDDAVYKAAEAVAKAAEIGIWSLPPPDVGKISCTSTPSNAAIYLDGKEEEDKTEYRTSRTLKDIAVGEHTLMFKGSTKCDECFCERLKTVIKDDTVDAYCKLCAIYEIHQPYYCKEKHCAEGIHKESIQPYIYIDGNDTGERARAHTIIKFGNDIDDNPYTLGGRECDFGTHTVELRFIGHKTVKATKKIDPGDFFSITPEIPEGDEAEEVSPTPTPSPGDPSAPIEETTGILHVGHVFDDVDRYKQISTGSNPFKIWLRRAGEFECDCHNYVPGDIVFGPGKFCDPKKGHRQCHAELGTYTLIIKYTGYEMFEYPFTIEAGDNITVPTIYMKEQVAITSEIDIDESIIPAEIYLNTIAPFTIKAKNTSEQPLQYKLHLSFSGVDIANAYTFLADTEWSETVDAGGKVGIPVSVTLPTEALPIGEEEAIYNISTLLEARTV